MWEIASCFIVRMNAVFQVFRSHHQSKPIQALDLPEVQVYICYLFSQIVCFHYFHLNDVTFATCILHLIVPYKFVCLCFPIRSTSSSLLVSIPYDVRTRKYDTVPGI